MTARLGHTPARLQPPSTFPAKFVDEALQRKGSRALDVPPAKLAGAGFLGHGTARKLWLETAAVGGFEYVPPPAIISDKEAMSRDMVDLDREELRAPRSRVIDYLPMALRPFLEKMSPARRREREDAILRKCEWEGLEILDLDVDALADKAKRVAAKFAALHPATDPAYQTPEHRRGRCEKVQARRLRKAQRCALRYVGAALGAAGGPDKNARPLYVSDYSLRCYRQQERRTAAVLEGLRLIKKLDPTVQISMTEVNARAQVAAGTKRRLLVDMMLTRWKRLGWHVCWITVSLPGQYVPHATNEGHRATEWNPDFGPEEAFAALQDDHHRVLARLRERGVRPTGWWNAQPQQSGTPHRHYVLACPTIEDARAVCDGFKVSFSTRIGEGEDRGCAAYVIGDEDPKYAPHRGKDGSVETAESVAKYAARYGTRMEKIEDGQEVDLEDLDRPATEFERFRAWKSLNGCRTHAWLGLDSRRAPGELWDTLWANAQRDEYDPADARMAIAMREMRDVQRYATIAAEARKAAESLDDGDDKESLGETVRVMNEDAAFRAWHAAIALGMWPDTDLDRDELKWLRDAVDEWNEENGMTDIDPLPPMPLREVKISAFDEEYKKTTGAVGAVRRFYLEASAAVGAWLEVAENEGIEVQAPTVGKMKIRHVVKALRDAGIGFSKRPSGRVAGFDLSGEILLRTVDEWEIVDEETAKMRIEEFEKAEKLAVLERLSFSPTDPSHRPVRPHLGEKVPVDGPS